jgi:hypothetical protein
MSERQPTEEELRAALEEEMKQITVDDVLVQTVVSIINLAGRRAGMTAGSEDERDLEQVRLAVEAVRALLPLLEQGPAAGQIGAIRDALSQLQLAYARGQAAPATPEGAATGAAAGDAATGGQGPPEGAPGSGEQGGAEQGQPGPAQRSGRLWVPGQ